jgi:hypothetical protein
LYVEYYGSSKDLVGANVAFGYRINELVGAGASGRHLLFDWTQSLGTARCHWRGCRSIRRWDLNSFTWFGMRFGRRLRMTRIGHRGLVRGIRTVIAAAVA